MERGCNSYERDRSYCGRHGTKSVAWVSNTKKTCVTLRALATGRNKGWSSAHLCCCPTSGGTKKKFKRSLYFVLSPLCTNFPGWLPALVGVAIKRRAEFFLGLQDLLLTYLGAILHFQLVFCLLLIFHPCCTGRTWLPTLSERTTWASARSGTLLLLGPSIWNRL